MRLVCCLLFLLPPTVMADGETRPVSDTILRGRSSDFASIKDKLLKEGGGNSESEMAVARGLAWVHRNRLKDGSWKSEGTEKDDRVIATVLALLVRQPHVIQPCLRDDPVSATSLALLAYLGAGVTVDQSSRYGPALTGSLKYLLSRQKIDGSFENVTNIDGHSWATIALCEASVLADMKGVKPAAEKALDWLLKSQHRDGSWGMANGKLGPVVFLAWPIQALWVARITEFEFSREETYEKIGKLLNSRSWDSGITYGLAKDEPLADLTSAAPACRYLTGWVAKHPALVRAGEAMVQHPVSDENPVLHQRHYFETQFLHAINRSDWHKKWNPSMRDFLVGTQNRSADENLKGSWSPDGGDIGDQYGRLGCTVMSLLSLQVYYRYVPFWQADLKPSPPEPKGPPLRK
ncbi:prenyltransferase/squalene oxidase repeat-containing protein [Zavarzinella formosa]|uniref:prenyltransferase/squalene oxidase repeat-containing protein n=1 Tax=Zavarzinella formosa TaxID=360055 RepID=UPI00030A970A|nr:prenyltransferase/squalene oxidase repeat-containing protein [Zavarzinella formosa]